MVQKVAVLLVLQNASCLTVHPTFVATRVEHGQPDTWRTISAGSEELSHVILFPPEAPGGARVRSLSTFGDPSDQIAVRYVAADCCWKRLIRSWRVHLNYVAE